jgi:hypothetical protein
MAALTAAALPVQTRWSPRAAVTHAADDIPLLSSGAEPVGLPLGNGLADPIPRVLEVHSAIQFDVADLHADPEVERIAYFVVTAAVGNAIKYAGPDAMISVTITNTDGLNGEPTAEDDRRQEAADFLTVEVRDNGRGKANSSRHGLTLMAERVSSVGGDLRITSPIAEGTAVRAILPRRLAPKPEVGAAGPYALPAGPDSSRSACARAMGRAEAEELDGLLSSVSGAGNASLPAV